MDFTNKKVLFLGFSLTSKKSAEYFLKKNANVFISEYAAPKQNEKQEAKRLEDAGAKIEFGGHSQEFIKDSDFAIISPSIKDDAPVLAELKCPIYSDIEFAALKLGLENRIIMITGTNGKTTTTMLTSAVLCEKYDAPYAGNIGVPPLYLLKDKTPDYLVVETSSYQLHYSKKMRPYIGVLCNITPDHISWHNGMESYIKDKTDILKRMDENSYVILNYDDIHTEDFVKDIKANIYYFSLNKIDYENLCYLDCDTIYFKNEKILNINQTSLKGAHNYQNIMCAIITAKLAGLSSETIKTAITKFKAPSHRLEFIRKIGKTAYYNDSKATNPEASNVAINSFLNKKTVLIAGGRDKNTPLDEFISCIKQRIDKVVLIGEARERFEAELKKAGYEKIQNAKTLDEAIEKAAADNPDIVLFSPACASFDMFENYEARGDYFRNYVLQKRAAE